MVQFGPIRRIACSGYAYLNIRCSAAVCFFRADLGKIDGVGFQAAAFEVRDQLTLYR